MRPKTRRQRWVQRLPLCAAIVLAVIIIWIDIATPFWQEVVILAGVAGAALTSLFTIFVVNRAVARQNARRWAPMIRLALTEFLHVLADDAQSEISRGMIVPRSITEVTAPDAATLHELRLAVVSERTQLSAALSDWAEILSSSGANDLLLLYIADLAVHLDEIRDSSLELEHRPSATSCAALNHQIHTYNNKFRAAVTEIQRQLTQIPRTVITLEPSPETSDAPITPPR